jgi:lipopolysaccharide exporter
MSLGKKVFSSAFLLLLRKIWSNVINLVVMAFLARILSKEDFGLLAISSVFLSIINTLATSGIAEYVVYYDGDDKAEKLNAAFWLNLFLTIAVVVVVVTTGPWWAHFYENKKVYSLLLLLCVSFFFEMGSTIPKALLRKELEYKSLVYYSTVSMTIISVGKLVAASTGFGVYSLALPQALVSPFLMMAFFLKTNWKPFATIGYAHYKAIVDYSKHIIGGRVLTKLVNEGDNLIVGKFIGMEGLGIYALAFQLANLVTSNVVVLVNDIFLPLFSKVKGDVERLRKLYCRMIQFLGFISFPLITALSIAAEPLVYYIYGEKWMDAVLPFQILCLFTLGRSISSPSSSVYNALGRPEIGFKIALVYTPIFLISVFVGSHYGVVGVAVFTTIVRVIGSIVSIQVSLRLIYLSTLEFFEWIKSNLYVTILFTLLFVASVICFDRDVSYLDLLLIPLIPYLHLLCQRIFFFESFKVLLTEAKEYIKFKVLNEFIRKAFFVNNAS